MARLFKEPVSAKKQKNYFYQVTLIIKDQFTTMGLTESIHVDTTLAMLALFLFVMCVCV